MNSSILYISYNSYKAFTEAITMLILSLMTQSNYQTTEQTNAKLPKNLMPNYRKLK